jgi:hypothetical protein
MRMIRLAGALALLLAAGCVSGIPPERLKTWVGRPAATLEKDWGPPTREVQEGDLRILIYEEVENPRISGLQGTTSAYRRGAVQSPDEPSPGPAVYVRSYLFWVNPQGTIVDSAVRAP